MKYRIDLIEELDKNRALIYNDGNELVASCSDAVMAEKICNFLNWDQQEKKVKAAKPEVKLINYTPKERRRK